MAGALTVRVFGHEQLGDLAKRLRKAGRTDLRRELVKGLRVAGKRVADEAKGNVLALPSPSGAIRRRVAKSVKVRIRTGARNPGVQVVSTDTPLRPSPRAKPMAVHLNIGTWRHPTFGHRVWVLPNGKIKSAWFPQHVPPGWFDRAAADKGPEARKEVLAAMKRVKAKLEHGG